MRAYYSKDLENDPHSAEQHHINVDKYIQKYSTFVL